MAFLAKTTICEEYGKYFANLTDTTPCVSFVATGREREEESRVWSNIRMWRVSLLTGVEGTAVQHLEVRQRQRAGHSLTGRCWALPGGYSVFRGLYSVSRGLYSVFRGLVLFQWHHLTQHWGSVSLQQRGTSWGYRISIPFFFTPIPHRSSK